MNLLHPFFCQLSALASQQLEELSSALVNLLPKRAQSVDHVFRRMAIGCCGQNCDGLLQEQFSPPQRRQSLNGDRQAINSANAFKRLAKVFLMVPDRNDHVLRVPLRSSNVCMYAGHCLLDQSAARSQTRGHCARGLTLSLAPIKQRDRESNSHSGPRLRPPGSSLASGHAAEDLNAEDQGNHYAEREASNPAQEHPIPRIQSLFFHSNTSRGAEV